MSWHYSPTPAFTLVIELAELEAKILEYGNEMRTEDARSLHNTLISYYKGFVNFDLRNWGGFDFDKWCIHSDFVIKQLFRLEKKLLQFFSPVYTLSPMVSDSKVNDQLDTTADILSPLLQKQKFFIGMIDSLEPTGDLNLQEVKVQSKHLDKFYEKFISNQSEIATLVKDASFSDQLEISQTVQHKVRQIQTKLEIGVSSLTGSDNNFKVNDQLATTTSNLSALLRKQQFYTNMIDSLASTNGLNSVDAKQQLEHLNQFYEKFISNQSEITALVEDASFADQVEISQKVQQTVRQIQTKLEEIISSIKTIPQTLTRSVINEHFDQTERPRVIVDFLDSQIKKQKSVIKQIELIDSKNDLSAVEAEILLGHLSQLHDAFVKNQSKIEAYINGPALDEQLQITEGILQKVIAVQIKLKGILAPVVVTSSVSQAVSSAEVNAHVKSLESVSSVPKADLSADVEAQVKPSELPNSVSSVDVEAQVKLLKVGKFFGVPNGRPYSEISAQIESLESVTSALNVSSFEVEAQGKSLGSQSYLNNMVEAHSFLGNEIYKKILQNIDQPPEVARSIHLRLWVADSYKWFVSNLQYFEYDLRKFPYLVRKVEEISERVKRAVQDYILYCEGQIPKENLKYISSYVLQ